MERATTGVGAACAACVLSETGDASWGPIVTTSGSNGERGFYNFGACCGFVIGASCGRAVQYLEFCLDAACDTCATTSAERSACIDAAVDGMCKGFSDALTKECPNVATFTKRCNNITSSIKTLCGP